MVSFNKALDLGRRALNSDIGQRVQDKLSERLDRITGPASPQPAFGGQGPAVRPGRPDGARSPRVSLDGLSSRMSRLQSNPDGDASASRPSVPPRPMGAGAQPGPSRPAWATDPDSPFRDFQRPVSQGQAATSFDDMLRNSGQLPRPSGLPPMRDLGEEQAAARRQNEAFAKEGELLLAEVNSGHGDPGRLAVFVGKVVADPRLAAGENSKSVLATLVGLKLALPSHDGIGEALGAAVSAGGSPEAALGQAISLAHPGNVGAVDGLCMDLLAGAGAACGDLAMARLLARVDAQGPSLGDANAKLLGSRLTHAWHGTGAARAAGNPAELASALARASTAQQKSFLSARLLDASARSGPMKKSECVRLMQLLASGTLDPSAARGAADKIVSSLQGTPPPASASQAMLPYDDVRAALTTLERTDRAAHDRLARAWLPHVQEPDSATAMHWAMRGKPDAY